MLIRELLEYVVPGNWIYVNDGHCQIFYGLPDAEFRRVIDVYIKVMGNG